LDKKTD